MERSQKILADMREFMRGETAPPPPDYNTDNWRQGADCQYAPDPEIFFDAASPLTVKEAKQMCAACAVRAFCLAEAIDHDEPFGIWGGKTADERRKARRRPLK